jgi:hypothetical protein
MTRIVPYSSNEDIGDFETLEITIKAIPFEDSYAPVFYISSPSDDYVMDIEELSCLMDGVDIARKNIDDIIDFLLRSKKDGE